MWIRLQGGLIHTDPHMSGAVAAGRRTTREQGTLIQIMPSYLLGPTPEEVQVWLRSAPDWVLAGFVLNVEAVNARLGRVLVVEDDPGIATQLVRGLTRAGYETGSVTTGAASGALGASSLAATSLRTCG